MDSERRLSDGGRREMSADQFCSELLDRLLTAQAELGAALVAAGGLEELARQHGWTQVPPDFARALGSRLIPGEPNGWETAGAAVGVSAAGAAVGEAAKEAVGEAAVEKGAAGRDAAGVLKAMALELALFAYFPYDMAVQREYGIEVGSLARRSLLALYRRAGWSPGGLRQLAQRLEDRCAEYFAALQGAVWVEPMTVVGRRACARMLGAELAPVVATLGPYVERVLLANRGMAAGLRVRLPQHRQEAGL